MQNITKLRKALIDSVSQYKDSDCCVMLSSGVDSQSILFALLEAGIRPHCYSFTRDDALSTDYKCARAIAQYFDLNFTKVAINTDKEFISKRLMYLMKYNLKSKTTIECTYLMYSALKKAKNHDIVFVGNGADTLYGLSKNTVLQCWGKGVRCRDIAQSSYDERKAMTMKVHLKLKKVGHAFDRFTDGVPTNEYEVLKLMGKDLGIVYKLTYYDTRVQQCFDLPFIELNSDEKGKFSEKFLTREAFRDYFCQIDGLTKKHQNYHLGDTGFQDMFKQLLDSSINKNGYTSIIKLYNSLIKEHTHTKGLKKLF